MPEDHQVVGEDHEHHGAVLAVVGAGAERFAEAAFDHAEDGLDLDALAVGFAALRAAELLGHEAAVTAGGLLVGVPRAVILACGIE